MLFISKMWLGWLLSGCLIESAIYNAPWNMYFIFFLFFFFMLNKGPWHQQELVKCYQSTTICGSHCYSYLMVVSYSDGSPERLIGIDDTVYLCISCISVISILQLKKKNDYWHVLDYIGKSLVSFPILFVAFSNNFTYILSK